MDTQPIVKWLNKELSELLECEVGDDYSKNILTIQTEAELREFIGSLLDLNQARNKKFLDELLTKIKKPSNYQDVKVYVKPSLEDETSSSKSKTAKKAEKTSPETTTTTNAPKNPISEYKHNKKNTFSLTTTHSTSNKPAVDRRVCECQASRHKLIGNCLKCGRIVCEQEGSGPCYFCGNLVCTREEFEKISRGSNKGEQLKADLLSRGWKGFDFITEDLKLLNLDANADNDSLRKAIEHKNKLIDFDRTSAKRTQVIDDQSDYFNTNSKWLSQKQKEMLQQKEEELNEKRFNRTNNTTFTLDFAGRRVIDDRKVITGKDYEPEIETILGEKTYVVESPDARPVMNQDIDNIELKFIEENKPKKKIDKVDDKEKEKNKNIYRIQDQELQEMRDDGMCLSMHQPWASLLVAGIKAHEGRAWYTPYRGRLWIHAGSKQPDDADIKEVETFYKCFYVDRAIKFPTSYPTSCLLGYVDLNDCLSSDVYKTQFPNGESDSEFVFICSNPRELVAKLPMSGQHKIFKLDKKLHQTAKKTSVIYHEQP